MAAMLGRRINVSIVAKSKPGRCRKRACLTGRADDAFPSAAPGRASQGIGPLPRELVSQLVASLDVEDRQLFVERHWFVIGLRISTLVTRRSGGGRSTALSMCINTRV